MTSTESNLTSSKKFVFFTAPIGRRILTSWILVGLSIYDFSSDSAVWNLTEVYRKQVFSVQNLVEDVEILRPVNKTVSGIILVYLIIVNDTFTGFCRSNECALRESLGFLN